MLKSPVAQGVAIGIPSGLAVAGLWVLALSVDSHFLAALVFFAPLAVLLALAEFDWRRRFRKTDTKETRDAA